MRSAVGCLALATLVIALPASGGVVTGAALLDLGLSAPASICATHTEIAVVEPGAHLFTVFSALGVRISEVELTGRPLGIASFGDGQYLVGQRDGGGLIRIDTVEGTASPFVVGLQGLAGLAVSGDRVAALEDESSAIHFFDAMGRQTGTLQLNQPGATLRGLAWDAAADRFWSIDVPNALVVAFDRSGRIVASFGEESGASLSRPASIVTDARGLVYVADRYQGSISVLSFEQGLVATVTAEDLQELTPSLPLDIALDPSGALFVVADAQAEVLVLDLELQGVGRPGAIAATIFPGSGAQVALRELVFRFDVVADATGSADLMAFVEVADGVSQAGIFASEALPVTDRVIDGATVRASSSWTAPTALAVDHDYQWRVRVDQGGVEGTWSGWTRFRVVDVPKRFIVEGNHPNPFNPRTEILFQLPERSRVTVLITDARGQRVKQVELGLLDAGRRSAIWDGSDDQGQQVSSGVYFYRVQTETESGVGKMLLVR